MAYDEERASASISKDSGLKTQGTLLEVTVMASVCLVVLKANLKSDTLKTSDQDWNRIRSNGH